MSMDFKQFERLLEAFQLSLFYLAIIAIIARLTYICPQIHSLTSVALFKLDSYASFGQNINSGSTKGLKSHGDKKFEKRIQIQGSKMAPTLLGVHLDVVEMLGGEAGGVGALQLAVRVLQLAVGTLQLAVGAFQLAVGTL